MKVEWSKNKRPLDYFIGAFIQQEFNLYKKYHNSQANRWTQDKTNIFHYCPQWLKNSIAEGRPFSYSPQKESGFQTNETHFVYLTALGFKPEPTGQAQIVDSQVISVQGVYTPNKFS
jgi:hypothetical protein